MTQLEALERQLEIQKDQQAVSNKAILFQMEQQQDRIDTLEQQIRTLKENSAKKTPITLPPLPARPNG